MLHPLYRSLGFTWWRGKEFQIDGYRHLTGDAEPDRFLKSPYYYLLKHGLDHLRRLLDTGSASEFPIFEDLRQAGLTDYLAFANSFAMSKGQEMLDSWATDQQGGFTDDEIKALLHLQDSLAVACKMAMREEFARNALSTYLSGNAGARVLSGQIKRGDGETIRAALVWGDLRDSTVLAEQLGRQLYIHTLNAFFDATAGAVGDAGGEILSFIGDGFLAAFPCDRNQQSPADACKQALSAAIEATQRMEELNRRRAAAGEVALDYGISLHVGNVMFGNVGLLDRLSFSAFGSAVNEAARLESLTKKFGTPIVASEHFTEYCGGKWEELGRETLRGLDADMAVLRPSPSELEIRQPIAARSRTREFSDAETIVLLSGDVTA